MVVIIRVASAAVKASKKDRRDSSVGPDGGGARRIQPLTDEDKANTSEPPKPWQMRVSGGTAGKVSIGKGRSVKGYKGRALGKRPSHGSIINGKPVKEKGFMNRIWGAYDYDEVSDISAFGERDVIAHGSMAASNAEYVDAGNYRQSFDVGGYKEPPMGFDR